MSAGATNALEKLHRPAGMTLGIEPQLDNGFAYPGNTPGMPNLDRHHARATLADKLGFAAIWMRGVVAK